jgi:hypothetical protein
MIAAAIILNYFLRAFDVLIYRLRGIRMSNMTQAASCAGINSMRQTKTAEVNSAGKGTSSSTGRPILPTSVCVMYDISSCELNDVLIMLVRTILI